jgi:formylglycine-generating enzyme required for sulfatase activity
MTINIVIGLIMKGNKIRLKHSVSNLIIEAKVGYSWTVLFFGIFVPLFRGDILWSIISLVTTILTGGIFWWIFPSFYNKIYIKSLLEKGYIPSDDISRDILIKRGWIAADVVNKSKEVNLDVIKDVPNDEKIENFRPEENNEPLKITATVETFFNNISDSLKKNYKKLYEIILTFPNKEKFFGIVIGLIILIIGLYFFVNRKKRSDQTNSIGMEFMLIPSGAFMMGCSDGDTECGDDEKPQHKVSISKSFYMGKYEVTQGQWKQVMGNNPSLFKECGENCPVDRVSWNDTQEFIEKICELEKMNPCKYRLPTEAEWEYAARAGATTELYNGKLENNGYFESKNLDQIGWFAGNAKATYEGGFNIRDVSVKEGLEFFKNAPHQFAGTQVVGKKEPNAWGLHDMIGNVYEWSEDWYDEKYYDKTPLLDPKGADKSERCSLRGGSWFNSAGGIRLSYRYNDYPDSRVISYGFRLVLLP